MRAIRAARRVDWGVSELATLTAAGATEAAAKVNMPQDGKEPPLASLQTFRIRADVQWVRKSS